MLIHHLAGGLDWREAYVRWEVSLLAALGYGLELGRCAVTGAVDGLIWVSPRTGRGVSAVAGEPYRDRLLPLPAFLLESGASAGKGDIAAGLTLTAHFLEKHVYGPERRPLPPARQAFAMRMDRSGRMAGG